LSVKIGKFYWLLCVCTYFYCFYIFYWFLQILLIFIDFTDFTVVKLEFYSFTAVKTKNISFYSCKCIYFAEVKICLSAKISKTTITVNISIGLYDPLDGITNPKYKLLHFLATIFCKEKKALAFYRDKCCHLALCLQLILFHCNRSQNFFSS